MIAAAPTDPESLLLEREAVEELEREPLLLLTEDELAPMLKRLARRHAQVVVLRMQGLSFAQIADELGCDASRCVRHHRRAAAQLRLLLEHPSLYEESEDEVFERIQSMGVRSRKAKCVAAFFATSDYERAARAVCIARASALRCVHAVLRDLHEDGFSEEPLVRAIEALTRQPSLLGLGGWL